MTIYHLDVKPCPAPRQVASDRYRVRPAVANYRAFRDRLDIAWKKTGAIFPESGVHIIFNMPMPKGWSKRKKSEMLNRFHRGRPDLDNLLKAFLDALFRGTEDAHIASLTVSKRWTSSEGSIDVIIDDR